MFARSVPGGGGIRRRRGFPVDGGGDTEGSFEHLRHIAGAVKAGLLRDFRQGKAGGPQVFGHFPQPEIHQVFDRAFSRVSVKNPVEEGTAGYRGGSAIL